MMDVHSASICDEDIRFEFNIRFPPSSYSEVKAYVKEFECKLLYLVDDDDERVIGRLSGYRFSLHDCYWESDENKNDYIDPFTILDIISDETAKLMHLFEDPFTLKPQYCKKLKDVLEPPNIVLIKRVEVLAKYRGKNFGETLISNSIYMIGRRGDIVILRPFPLQFEVENNSQKSTWRKEMKLSSFVSDKETARKKLNNYYKKLGFKKLNNDGFVFLTLQNVY